MTTATVRNPGFARWRRWAGLLLIICLLAPVHIACTDTTPKAEPPKPKYPTLPARAVPAFLKGTIYEIADSENKKPYLVSGYGLVVGLAGTGDNRGAPLSVRNFMIDEMVRHGFGSVNLGLGKLQPETVLADPSSAIVEVYGLIPPGARRGQPVDVYVQAATGTGTRSLARGRLYQSSLYVNGVDPLAPFGRINAYMSAKGSVFVNPGYLGDAGARTTAARASLTKGIVLGGGVCTTDRPVWIRVRQPQLSIARAIKYRIDERFRINNTARTQDEGLVYVFVPPEYVGDFDHFLGVLMHLYLNSSPGFGALRARDLALEAVKPDAPLRNISFAWEGIGDEALPYVRPLYTNKSPDVAYAATRAGACLGDAAGVESLMEIARSDGHPFQLNAVRTMAFLPASTRVDRMLSDLLSVNNALVRVEAYKILVEHGSPAILTRQVGSDFLVDRVFCEGPPLVYASRSGAARIAIFGQDTAIPLPVMFSAMQSRFTISTNKDHRTLLIFDRTDDRRPSGQVAASGADLLELILTLGDTAASHGLHFAYSDVVGILKQMADEKVIASSFMLQDLASFEDAIENAPPIVEPDGQAPAAPSITGLPGEGGVRMPGIIKPEEQNILKDH